MSKSIQCPSCLEEISVKELENNHKVCPLCNHHFRLSLDERIKLLCDCDTFKELPCNNKTGNPLSLKGYEEKIKQQRDKSNLKEAVVIGNCSINKRRSNSLCNVI